MNEIANHWSWSDFHPFEVCSELLDVDVLTLKIIALIALMMYMMFFTYRFTRAMLPYSKSEKKENEKEENK